MLASLTIQFVIIVFAIGFLGLIPLFIINRKSANSDNALNDNFDASKSLSNFRSNESEMDSEPDMDKKLKSFKIKN